MKFYVWIGQPGYNKVRLTYTDYADVKALLEMLIKDTENETTISIQVEKIKINQPEEDEEQK